MVKYVPMGSNDVDFFCCRKTLQLYTKRKHKIGESLILIFDEKAKFLFQIKKRVTIQERVHVKKQKCFYIHVWKLPKTTNRKLLTRFEVNCRQLAVGPNQQFYTLTRQEKGRISTQVHQWKWKGSFVIKLSTFSAHQ